ncbi:MAG: diaminopimelate epimerase [Nitrospira bacterium HGW-Nitrospira-1]|nr:MAG: diaminopimelate epimerase [Nitrospira bacterium HGW-Nitrospira-1]
MNLRFTKMHGLGNDFILIDCRDGKLNSSSGLSGSNSLSGLSIRLCHRRFGIGADQVLLLYPSAIADFKMVIFNADGSEVEMCGNGIRCFAKYIWDRGLSDKGILLVETAAGIIKPERIGQMVRVDMGEPILEGRLIPVNLPPHPPLNKGGRGGVIDFPLKIADKEFKITAVSMGNPHAVIFVDDVAGIDVKKYGPLIENHALFPKRINVEFIQVIDSERIKMRVWERGAGETMACGTGASAAGVASYIKGFTARQVDVLLRGGELGIEWKEDNHVYMTGPASDVFEGSIKLGDRHFEMPADNENTIA